MLCRSLRLDSIQHLRAVLTSQFDMVVCFIDMAVMLCAVKRAVEVIYQLVSFRGS